jgi:carotenoid cleavage dioxygenase-like enzyme
VDKEDTSPYNLEIEGVIPQGLIGNYFVTGPGVLKQGMKIALIDFFRILYTFCHIQVF